MEKVSLIIALKRTILEGCKVMQLRSEFNSLDEKDKADLIVEFNKVKPFGDGIEVVLKKV